MVSPGNHEASCREIGFPTLACPKGQQNFTDFLVRFGTTMLSTFDSPSSDDAARISANKARLLARPPFWYSFDYGMVHFLMIDIGTETDFPNSEEGPRTHLVVVLLEARVNRLLSSRLILQVSIGESRLGWSQLAIGPG